MTDLAHVPASAPDQPETVEPRPSIVPVGYGRLIAWLVLVAVMAIRQDRRSLKREPAGEKVTELNFGVAAFGSNVERIYKREGLSFLSTDFTN